MAKKPIQMGGLFDSFDAKNILPKIDVSDYLSKFKGNVQGNVQYKFNPESLGGFKAKIAEDVAGMGGKAMQSGGALEKLMALAKANPKTALATGGLGALLLTSRPGREFGDIYNINATDIDSKMSGTLKNNEKLRKLMKGNN